MEVKAYSKVDITLIHRKFENKVMQQLVDGLKKKRNTLLKQLLWEKQIQVQRMKQGMSKQQAVKTIGIHTAIHAILQVLEIYRMKLTRVTNLERDLGYVYISLDDIKRDEKKEIQVLAHRIQSFTQSLRQPILKHYIKSRIMEISNTGHL